MTVRATQKINRIFGTLFDEFIKDKRNKSTENVYIGHVNQFNQSNNTEGYGKHRNSRRGRIVCNGDITARFTILISAATNGV